ncbi:hypothetical protein ABPG74_013469 [Tetrahymena malaccensis]
MDKLFGRVIRRNQAAEEFMKNEEAKAHEKETVKQNMYIQTGIKVALRLSFIGSVAVLYKRGFFAKQSPFFMKELLLMAGGYGVISIGDFFASEYMWSNAGTIIRRYTNYSDSYYVDDKTYNKMKEMYKLKQNQPQQTVEYQENKDKMYD